MKTKVIKKSSKNPKMMILTEIKRSQGLSVSELCDRIGLSYMGVKQHCVALEKEGYLDTWRRPKGMGRPEKAYRLTGSAQEFFPSEDSTFTTEILSSVNRVYGANAAEKILHNIYVNHATILTQQCKSGSLEDKAKAINEFRNELGYMSEYYFNPDIQKHQVIEYNTPIYNCIQEFPIIRDLEKLFYQQVSGVGVDREETRVSGCYSCIFTFAP